MAFLNAGSISYGQPSPGGSAYIPTKGTATSSSTSQQPTQQANPIYGANAVRPTQGGPFDSAYRQNLATYAGGTLANPGLLQFDPTGSLFGSGTGAGNAPVPGSPTTLLSQALGQSSLPGGAGANQNQSSNGAQSLTNWLASYGAY